MPVFRCGILSVGNARGGENVAGQTTLVVDENHHKFEMFRAALDGFGIELRGRSPGRFDVVSKAADRWTTADILRRVVELYGIETEVVEE